MEYSLRAFKIGEARAPGPLSLYMSGWDVVEWAPHFIWLAQGGGRSILVNAGLLAFGQAVAVVLGADIGTTITAWIVSALGIGKFKISTYALPVIFIGFLVNFLAKSRKRKMIGWSLLGFGIPSGG